MAKTILIDESGDLALNTTKASEYLIFGAAMIDDEMKNSVRERTLKILKTINTKRRSPPATNLTNLHAVKLKHKDLNYVYSEISKLPVTIFGFVSKKETLNTQQVKQQEWDAPQKYYNLCVRMLCEIIGGYHDKHQIRKDNTNFVLEKRRHDYEKLRRYLSACALKPADSNVDRLKGFRFHSHMSASTKSDEVLLGLADFVTYSLWRSFAPSEQAYGVVDFSYFSEIKHLFAQDDDGVFLDHGIKVFKWQSIKWNSRQKRLIDFLNGIKS